MTRRRIQAHSSNGATTNHVTKVLGASRISWICTLFFLLAPLLPIACAAENPPAKPAEALYLQLGSVGLDTARVYQVRDASLDRAAIHISLEDGTIAFTQDVMGRVTGAFFEGDGEILLVPPNEVERKSMSLFTGMAILEERFATAYFRFNDDLMAELKPDLRDTGPQQEFLERTGPAAKNLANIDAMRLLTTFSHMLPSADGSSSAADASQRDRSDRFLHARLQGTKLGVFDVYFDSTAAEQVLVGQPKTAGNGETYYDVWTSFSVTQTTHLPAHAASPESPGENIPGHRTAVPSYKIRTEVIPPKQIQATASLQCEVGAGGGRVLLFELSRFLQIEKVTLDGQPVEYIHNPALEGTHLARQGNDVVAVILPRTARTGETFELEFKYGGEVLAEAGSGLLYVGARGTWYPNRGLEMANFDLEFRYPTDWTLVATGKPAPIVSGEIPQESGTEQRSHWISDRPIPLAGFNLGKYREVTTRAGDVTVETYATTGVEKDFPSASIKVIEPPRIDAIPRTPQVIAPSRPSPARQELVIGETAARAIEYFSQRFGPFPYSHLALTQMPGRESQGWPGLVFLSSYAFLDDQQREQLHIEPYRILLQQSVPAHETAHQWWGDLVTWRGYRDQWFSEGLANYSALMMLQEKDPAGFRQIMEAYRRDLVEKNKDGMTPMDAGPVTLGTRLLSSRFPGGYEAISYGRGTWLFHMLRTMLNDAQRLQSKKASGNPVPVEEPFVRALRNIREQYQGKSITTAELLQAFAAELPPSLRYEGKQSLDWFLDGWINGTALPKLELKSVKLASRGAGVTASGMILQKEAPNDLVTSVPVYALISGRQPILLGRVFADGEETSFRFSVPAGTHKIVLDPYETVLSYPK